MTVTIDPERVRRFTDEILEAFEEGDETNLVPAGAFSAVVSVRMDYAAALAAASAVIVNKAVRSGAMQTTMFPRIADATGRTVKLIMDQHETGN